MPEHDPTENSSAPRTKYCARCGASLEIQMRFCDRCGANHAALCSPDGLCHWCGHQGVVESEACGRCGARLITICPRCGSTMKAGQNYCGFCGLNYEDLLQEEQE